MVIIDTNQLSPQALTELRKIALNDAALGAFSGMIFNDMKDLTDPKMWTEEDIRVRIIAAASIRVLVRDMAK